MGLIRKELVTTTLDTYKRREDFVAEVGGVELAAGEAPAASPQGWGGWRGQAALRVSPGGQGFFASGDLIHQVRLEGGGIALHPFADLREHIHPVGTAGTLDTPSATQHPNASLAVLSDSLLLAGSTSGRLLLLRSSPGDGDGAKCASLEIHLNAVCPPDIKTPLSIVAACEAGGGGGAADGRTGGAELKVAAVVAFSTPPPCAAVRGVGQPGSEGAEQRLYEAGFKPRAPTVHHTKLLCIRVANDVVTVESLDLESSCAECGGAVLLPHPGGSAQPNGFAATAYLLHPQDMPDDDEPTAGVSQGGRPAYTLRAWGLALREGSEDEWVEQPVSADPAQPRWLDLHSGLLAAAFDVDFAVCQLGGAGGDPLLWHSSHIEGMHLISSTRERAMQYTMSTPASRYSFVSEPDLFTVFSRADGCSIGDEATVPAPGLIALAPIETPLGCDVVVLTRTSLRLLRVNMPMSRQADSAMDPEQMGRIAAALTAGGEW